MATMSRVDVPPTAAALAPMARGSPMGVGTPLGRCSVPGSGWRSWWSFNGCMIDTGGVDASARPYSVPDPTRVTGRTTEPAFTTRVLVAAEAGSMVAQAAPAATAMVTNAAAAERFPRQPRRAGIGTSFMNLLSRLESTPATTGPPPPPSRFDRREVRRPLAPVGASLNPVCHHARVSFNVLPGTDRCMSWELRQAQKPIVVRQCRGPRHLDSTDG